MRRLYIVLLVGLLLGAFFVGQAQAVTYVGGTPEQRSTVQSVLESCWLDYRWVEDTLGYVEISFKADQPAQGQAWRGAIVLRASLTGDELRHVAAHEWSHQIYWAVTYDHRWEWTLMVTGGTWDGTTWRTNPAENFAECMRHALWPRQAAPDTELLVIEPAACRAFLVNDVLSQGGQPWRTEF